MIYGLNRIRLFCHQGRVKAGAAIFCVLPIMVANIGNVQSENVVNDLNRELSGVISEVLESYPPQIVLQARRERFDLALREGTSVRVRGRDVGFGALKPDLVVKVVVSSFDPHARTGIAEEITVP